MSHKQLEQMIFICASDRLDRSGQYEKKMTKQKMNIEIVQLEVRYETRCLMDRTHAASTSLKLVIFDNICFCQEKYLFLLLLVM